MQKVIDNVLSAVTLPNTVVLNMPDPTNMQCTYSLLTRAIHQKNTTAINDILKYAKDNKFLSEVLSSKVTIEYCMVQARKRTYTPLTYAIAKKTMKLLNLFYNMPKLMNC